MPRIVYCNADFVPLAEAKISILDRAVLFGDAVYEVVAVLDGQLVDFAHHYARLVRSLRVLSIPCPRSETEVLATMRTLVARNTLRDGMVYIQISRGVGERDFAYPVARDANAVNTEPLVPTVFMFTQQKPVLYSPYAETGVAVMSVCDLRWARRDIKSVNLLGAVLAKQVAVQNGAYEALMIDASGAVTECSSANFFIYKDNTIITRPLSNDILPGITRGAIVRLCAARAIALEERCFDLTEVYAAEETFLSSASAGLLAVVQVDDHRIGSGKPGPIGVALRAMYIEHAKATAC